MVVSNTDIVNEDGFSSSTAYILPRYMLIIKKSK